MALGAILGGIGMGINLFGAFGAARAAQAAAKTNYLINMGNAETERGNTLAGLDLADVGNQIGLDNARLNLDFALMDSEARGRNAQRLRQFAETRTAQGREGIRRQQRAFGQFASSQRAGFASAGVTGEGSALDVLAESAGQMQIALKDANDAVGFERSETLNQAGLEEYGATRDATAARAGFSSAERGFNLGRAANQLGRMSAESNYRSARFGAQIGRLQGQNVASGQTFSAIGSFFSGMANLGEQRYQRNHLGF